MKAYWYKVNYGYLLVVALLGLTMRSVFVGFHIPLSYGHMLHTHSHIAFLGWIYGTLFLLIDHHFLKPHRRPDTIPLQFYISQALMMLMLAAFLIQGYGLYSILFSSLFQLMNYWFVFSVLAALKKHPHGDALSVRFLKTALWMLFLSTFGPWAVGAVKAMGFGDTHWYQLSIYYYLHFQYNGWILTAVAALFFAYVEKHYGYSTDEDGRQFYRWFAGAIIPGYFLSLLGMFPSPAVYLPAGLSALMQLVALCYLFRLVRRHKLGRLTYKQKPVQLLAFMVTAAFVLKVILQLFSLIPALAEMGFNNRNVVIAFLHLIMLGIITPYLMAHLTKLNKMQWQGSLSMIGLMSYFIGFVLTEFLLGTQFTGWWGSQFAEGVATATLFLALGIVLAAFAFSSKKKITACASDGAGKAGNQQWFENYN